MKSVLRLTNQVCIPPLRYSVLRKFSLNRRVYTANSTDGDDHHRSTNSDAGYEAADKPQESPLRNHCSPKTDASDEFDNSDEWSKSPLKRPICAPVSGDESVDKLREPPLQDLLDDSALGTGPLDEVDETDEWRTSPYPSGAVVNPKQSQGLKSLRPHVDPQDTSIILFPGQGSQYVGMGKDLIKFPAARDLFDAASEIMKFDLVKLMFNGPKEKLNQTKYCQPAVVVCSLAALEKLKEERPSAIENCIATAGFSVGEITALTFAGVFKFPDGEFYVVIKFRLCFIFDQPYSEITFSYFQPLN